jgi:small-conductance mechanosensitive channel
VDENADGRRDVDQDRLTVAASAAVLGITVDAVRKRIQRGTLISEKEPDGRVYVLLDTNLDTDTPRSERDAIKDERVLDLREQVAYLREQLDQEREARTEERRRHDTIIAQLTRLIPELEPPSDERRDVNASHDEPMEGYSDTGSPREDPQTQSSRGWWKRIFR